MRGRNFYVVSIVVILFLAMDIYLRWTEPTPEEASLRLLMERYGMTIEQSDAGPEKSLWDWKLEVWRGGPLPPSLVAFDEIDLDGNAEKSQFTMHELGERGASIGFAYEKEMMGRKVTGSRFIWTDKESDGYHEYIDFEFDGVFDFYRTASKSYIFYEHKRYQLVEFSEDDPREGPAIELDGQTTKMKFDDGTWQVVE